MYFPSYASLLQYDSPDKKPLLHLGATFVRFPDGPASFCLDVVKGLGGHKLVQMEHNGVWRLSVRRPNGNTLTPRSSQDRAILCFVDGKNRYFNVMNLLASVLLGRDVTDSEYAILVVEGGMWVESKQDRERLRDEREEEAVDLPRRELTIIPRPKSKTVDVTGQGYYVQGGKIYRKNGKALAVAKDGRCKMFSRGTQLNVHVGWVLFTAYPEFYGFDADVHEEVDHIDGDHKNNAPNNFRPVTRSQNSTLRHQTGSRVERPGPDSSYEQCKLKFGALPKEKTDLMISDNHLKQYEETWYWVHRLGTVFVRRSDNTFRYAEASVLDSGYVVSGGHKHHLMVMKVFGEYIKGMVVMHKDDNKQHNGLDNLRMGTAAENAHNSMAMTVQNPDGTTRAYGSRNEAARDLGIGKSSLSRNRKRNRDSPELCYSETRKGVRFACVDFPTGPLV